LEIWLLFEMSREIVGGRGRPIAEEEAKHAMEWMKDSGPIFVREARPERKDRWERVSDSRIIKNIGTNWKGNREEGWEMRVNVDDSGWGRLLNMIVLRILREIYRTWSQGKRGEGLSVGWELADENN
jgi:hypothetical protein